MADMTDRATGPDKLRKRIAKGPAMKKTANRDGIARAIRDTLGTFTRNAKGAAAVEFAFIVPILLLMYLGSMEVSQALDVDKRVGRTASEVADLVTQQESVTKAELTSIMRIGAATLQPYRRDTPTISVVAVQVDTSTNPKAHVVWSLMLHNNAVSTPVAAGTVVQLPNQISTSGAFLIKASTSLKYIPITSWAIRTGTLDSSSASFTIPMNETYYLRPRLTSTVTCTDC